jgi:TonB family protein
MNVAERRHVARAAPERPVYVDLNPDNGGIVLNVSGAGLCLQAVAPVTKHQSFRFSFSDHDVNTDAVGEVVWTDQTRKFAGLRFIRVSSQARHEISELVRFVPQVSDNDYENEASVATVPLAAEDELTMALAADPTEPMSSLQLALLREANRFPTQRVEEPKVSAAASKIASAPSPTTGKLKLRPEVGKARWSRIFVAALLVYAVGASVALYRTRKSQTPPANPMVQAASVTAAGASSPTQSAQASPVGNSKPPAVQVRPVVRHTAAKITKLPEPERPLMTGGPIRFEYPIIAEGTRSGTVDLKVLISATGAVQNVKVLAGQHDLANASVRAVKRWCYRPVESNGRPVPAQARVRIRFSGDDAVTISFRE